jgi:hypothetical protein
MLRAGMEELMIIKYGRVGNKLLKRVESRKKILLMVYYSELFGGWILCEDDAQKRA